MFFIFDRDNALCSHTFLPQFIAIQIIISMISKFISFLFHLFNYPYRFWHYFVVLQQSKYQLKASNWILKLQLIKCNKQFKLNFPFEINLTNLLQRSIHVDRIESYIVRLLFITCWRIYRFSNNFFPLNLFHTILQKPKCTQKSMHNARALDQQQKVKENVKTAKMLYGKMYPINKSKWNWKKDKLNWTIERLNVDLFCLFTLLFFLSLS